MLNDANRIEMLKKAQLLATEKSGKFLSKEYVNYYTTKYRWECAQGHKWEATFSSVKNGSWCQRCALKFKMTELQQFAEQKGGKCLSKKYVNCTTKYYWKCVKGHKWEASFSNIKNGSWCPRCVTYNRTFKDNVVELQRFAEQKGGKCLSEKYVGSSKIYTWECAKGHRWETTFTNVKNGSWCKRCFYANRKLKYSITELRQFAKQKGGKCLSKKYVNCTTKYYWKCVEGHKWEATFSSVKNGSWCPRCVTYNRTFKNNIADLQQFAVAKGGNCLSEKYVGCTKTYTWECAKGHRWETTFTNVKNGSWCKRCFYANRKLKYSITELRQFAKQKGGKCLSGKYTGYSKIYTWKCTEGHKWKATFSSIKNGSWCKRCVTYNRKLKYSIADLQQFAVAKGGKCLSAKYIGCTTKYLWECAQGHRWKATYTHVRDKYLCPQCNPKGKPTPQPNNTYNTNMRTHRKPQNYIDYSYLIEE